MIAIIDSGVANLTSVLAAFERLSIPAQITAEREAIRAAERVILPGVGSAATAMRLLESKGLVETIQGLTQPVLGICLGMQLLFTSSEEGAEEGSPTPCLGIVPGVIQKMKGGKERPIPHMGWNNIDISPKGDPLLQGVTPDAYMYFVHSFAAPEGLWTVARCNYGETFTAVCRHKNFWGCQFHPERSGREGQKILRNFVEMKI